MGRLSKGEQEGGGGGEFMRGTERSSGGSPSAISVVTAAHSTAVIVHTCLPS